MSKKEKISRGKKSLKNKCQQYKSLINRNNGITLIALIITIIVLLILAGVTISLTIGENGILITAKATKEKQKVAELLEKLELAKGDVYLNNKGLITLGQYIEELLKQNIITEDDILEETDIVKTVILEDVYEFLLEETNGNDVKITYKGKITLLTISFDSNGGTECAPKKVGFKTKYGNLPVPTKTGYTFAGWYLEEENNNGVGEQIYSNSILNTKEDRTLYARWTVNSYTITFDSNGGSNCESIQVNFNEAYGNLPIPTRTGYTFNGWYLEELDNNGTGKQITQDSILEEENNTTLHAQWIINTYTITYQIDGGINNSNNVTQANYNTNVTLYNPTRSTCTFNGWYTDASMNNQVTSIKVTGNITLYAKWMHSNACYGTVTQYHKLDRNRKYSNSYNMPHGCPYPGHTNCSVVDGIYTYYYTCNGQTYTLSPQYTFSACNSNGYVFNESGTEWYSEYPDGYPCNNHTELKCGY